MRLRAAGDWLARIGHCREVFVVGPTREAAARLIRSGVPTEGALFGRHPVTLHQLAASIAAPRLADLGLVAVSTLGFEGVVTHVIHEMRKDKSLGIYTQVSERPHFARAVSRSLTDLRAAHVPPETLATHRPDLGEIYKRVLLHLTASKLADRTEVLHVASMRLESQAPRELLNAAMVLFDVPLSCRAEEQFVAFLRRHVEDVFASVPVGDDRSAKHLSRALEAAPEPIASQQDASGVSLLQRRLFVESDGDVVPNRDASGVTVISAPGENRECVEIARRIHQYASDGVPFDRMAIALRAPRTYRAHLEQALRRASVPAFFSQGVVRPDPSGRALLALVLCAVDGLSAKRFAEYLSLGEVTEPQATGAPPEAPVLESAWVPPDAELDLLPRVAAEESVRPSSEVDEQVADPEVARVVAGSLRAPRRWERLLTDAAVIGGKDRWTRRLLGLRHQLEQSLTYEADPNSPETQSITRRIAELDALTRFALPLIEELGALPEEASWGEWLDRLSALALRALRSPDRVLSVLAELRPMSHVGPVGLREVQLVLSSRLSDLVERPNERAAGSVFVGAVESLRGLVFDVVFIPGLAEKIFPGKIAEDPLLRDGDRAAIGAELVVTDERVAQERLLLRLAVGAAERAVVLSYPRIDLDRSRPRTPSFYGLEVLRAAEGQLSGFDVLAQRAEQSGRARIGWPAPTNPHAAIDSAEHDLALLEAIFARDENETAGMAHYLLNANPHLARALRARARRWRRKWSQADGMVLPNDAARAALAKHALSARSFSPTALEKFARCPYSFFLYSVHKLEPREEPEPIEEMDPLSRGSMMHEVQFELLTLLRERKLLPLSGENFEVAGAELEQILERAAANYKDELAPAIERVWEDGIGQIRADLREWLRRLAKEPSWVPWRFELAFGLPPQPGRDESSRAEPVALECGIQLRGSIDLVERRDDGVLRATDYKTGKQRVKTGAVVSNAESLQPVLYALAIEKIFEGARVEGGRLYYSSSRGGFEEAFVPLDSIARKAIEQVAKTIGGAITEGFLPPAPLKGACEWCDYQRVCGPYEETRLTHKSKTELIPLKTLREMR